MVVKLTPAKYKYNLVSEDETARQLSTSGGNEIVSVLLTAGSSAAAVRIVDSASGASGYSRVDGFLVAARSSDAQEYVPAMPVPMKKGIYVIFEEGVGSNAECFITYN